MAYGKSRGAARRSSSASLFLPRWTADTGNPHTDGVEAAAPAGARLRRARATAAALAPEGLPALRVRPLEHLTEAHLAQGHVKIVLVDVESLHSIWLELSKFI